MAPRAWTTKLHSIHNSKPRSRKGARLFFRGCSVCIRVHPCPSVAQNQPSKADRTSKKTSDLATDGHGYTRMRSVGFLALDREKIGTKLYGYVLRNAILGAPGGWPSSGRPRVHDLMLRAPSYLPGT